MTRAKRVKMGNSCTDYCKRMEEMVSIHIFKTEKLFLTWHSILILWNKKKKKKTANKHDASAKDVCQTWTNTNCTRLHFTVVMATSALHCFELLLLGKCIFGHSFSAALKRVNVGVLTNLIIVLNI